MTLPTLIQERNNKELEVAFKKAYANLNNAFNLVASEGYPLYVRNPTETRPDGDVDYNPTFAKQVYAQYRKLQLIPQDERRSYNVSVKNYSKTKPYSGPQCSQLMAGREAFITPDGSTLAIMQNCGQLWFTIDTNGIYKGPNALGHDIFIFVADESSGTKRLIPAYNESEGKQNEDGSFSYNNTAETADKCSPTSNSDINGATCAIYAIMDKCPGDNTKSYWKCLPK